MSNVTSEQLRQARVASGLTQGQLSERIGLSRVSVSNMERGLQRISLDIAQKISDALGEKFWNLPPRPVSIPTLNFLKVAFAVIYQWNKVQEELGLLIKKELQMPTDFEILEEGVYAIVFLVDYESHLLFRVNEHSEIVGIEDTEKNKE